MTLPGVMAGPESIAVLSCDVEAVVAGEPESDGCVSPEAALVVGSGAFVVAIMGSLTPARRDLACAIYRPVPWITS